MDNQHKKIKGYRDLSQAEIDLMNEVKAKGEELRALVQKIRETVLKPAAATAGADVQDGSMTTTLVIEDAPLPFIEHEGDNPDYWLRWADGSFRSALMYATRAIAQPTSY